MLTETLIYPRSTWRQTICHLDFLRSWTSVPVMRKKKSLPYHGRVYLMCKLEKQLPRGGFCTKNYFFLNFWEISRKLHITEGNFSKFGSITLLYLKHSKGCFCNFSSNKILLQNTKPHHKNGNNKSPYIQVVCRLTWNFRRLRNLSNFGGKQSLVPVSLQDIKLW